MSTQNTLTPAEKRKATIAARAAKEIEENIAFQNQSRKFHWHLKLYSGRFTKRTEATGGRQAKKAAKENARMFSFNSDRFSRLIFSYTCSLER
jgi:hypothetical protein